MVKKVLSLMVDKRLQRTRLSVAKIERCAELEWVRSLLKRISGGRPEVSSKGGIL